MDTIFAVSSGRPPAAIAILRVSGPRAADVAERLAGVLPTPRQASLRALRAADGALLDRALTLWFPGPNSATGEDCLELHVHGGRAVIAAVEAAIGAAPGLRRAEPGEFTRRALLGGRIDLAQAAGLADLLEAETETQRRAAIASAEGALSRDLQIWLDRLSQIRATIEAMIDYDEEGDVAVTGEDVRPMLEALVADMSGIVARPTVERLRQGFQVVIAGPPNAGKSSLFNAILTRDAAIVAPIAGTTRDRLEGSVIRSGQIFTFTDTAGLAENTDDPIEAEGILRSRAAMETADLVLWLGDEPPVDIARSLWVRARCDVPGRSGLIDGQAFAISARRMPTIDTLWSTVAARAAADLGQTDSYLLHESQRETIVDAITSCAAAMQRADPILSAEDLRQASRGVGRLLGVDETEAMLDALFSRFCVGK